MADESTVTPLGLLERKRVERDEQDLRQSLTAGSTFDPGHEARARDLSVETGIPAPTVSRNLKEVESRNRFGEIDAAQLQKDSPGVAALMTTLDNSKRIEKEDVAQLTGLEWMLKAPARAFAQGEAMTQMGELGEKAKRQGLTDEDEARLEAMRGTLSADLGGDNFFERAYTGTFKALPYIGHVTMEGVKKGVKFGATAGGTALVAGQLGPQAVIPEEAVTVPVAAVGGFGVGSIYGAMEYTQRIEGGNAFLEYRDMRDVDGQKLDPRIAAIASDLAGMGSSIIETAGVGVLLKSLPGGQKIVSHFTKKGIKGLLRQPGVVKALGRLAGRYGGVWSAEVAAEVAQEATVILVGEAAKNYADEDFEPLSGEEITERLTETAITSAEEFFFISGIGPVLTTGIEVGSDISRARDARQHQQDLLDRMEAMAGPLADRSPDILEELYQSISDETGEGESHIDAKSAILRLEEAGADPVELFQNLGVSSEQLREAAEAGGDVVVKSGRLVTVLRDLEVRDVVLANVRKTPDALTVLEADQMDVRVEEEAEAEAARTAEQAAEQLEMEAIADQIYDDTVARMAEGGVESVAGQRYTLAELNRAHALRQMADWKAEGKTFDAKAFSEDLGVTYSRRDFVEGKTRDIQDVQLSGFINELRGMDDAGVREMERKALGPSISDVARETGLRDDRGDLFGADVDVDKQPFIRNMLRDDGTTIDALGERLWQEGFYAERPTPQQVIDDIVRDASAQSRDERVFAERNLDQEALDRLTGLEDISREMDRAGISLEEADNDAIIRQLRGDQGVEGEGTTMSQDAVENDLLKAPGETMMVGAETIILDTPDLKIMEADTTGTNRRSYRYVRYEDGEPVGALQIMTRGKLSKRTIIQNIYVVKDRRRSKVGANLLKRAREDFEVKHSTDLTDAGRAFARADGKYYQDKEAPRGGIRGDFGALVGAFNIFITPKADISTLLHETGHLFLEALHREANMEDAPKRVRDNYQAMLDFLGVDEFSQVGVEQHELWARTFEVYLREGKAPSIRLERAFSKFRAWLVSVYKTLTGKYDIKVNPEVREIFDRLLATDEEISAVEMQNAFRIDGEISDLMTEGERATYFRQAEDAHQEALSEALRKKVYAEQREATKIWKAEREKTRKRIEAETWAQPVYQAWHFLTKKEFFDSVTPDNVRGLKLNRQKLIDTIGTEGVLKDMPRTVPPMWSKDGGLHPDELAEMVGFGSGFEMIEALIAAERPNALIERLTDEAMDRDNPRPDVAEEALEAAFNDKRAAFLAAETRALRRRAGAAVAQSPLAAIRAAVTRVLSEKPIKEITKPFVYLNNSIRAGKRKTQALTNKDYQGAAEASAQQLFNYEMFRAALKIRDKSEKIAKKINDRARKKINPRKIAPEYIEQIKIVSQAIRDPDHPASSTLLRAAVKWAQAAVANIEDPASLLIPPMYATTVEAVGYRDMTFDELESLNLFLSSMWEEGKRRGEEAMEEFRVADAAMAALVEENAPKSPYTVLRKIPGPGGIKADEALREYLSALAKTTGYLREMDGFEEQGMIWSMFQGRAADMESAETVMLEEYMPQLRDIFDRYFTSKAEKARFQYTKIHLGDFGKLSTVTKEQLIMLALNWGNEDNILAVAKGYNVDPDALFAAMDQHLTKKDWDLVQEILDFNDLLWPEAEALEKRVTGTAPPKVEALPIQTRHGTYRGGYHRLKYDAKQSFGAAKDAKAEQFKDLVGGKGSRAGTKHGSLIERVGSGGKPVRLDIGVVFSHVNEVIHDITHREGVLEMNRFLMPHSQFAKAVTDQFGVEVTNTLNNWLINIGAGQVEPDNVFMKAFRHLRVGTTIIMMGYSISTMAVQVLGYLSSFARVGAKDMSRGMAAMALDPATAIKFAWDNSTVIRSRFSTFDRDVSTLSRSVKISGVKDEIVRFGFMGIGLMDLTVSIPTWYAGYLQGMRLFDGDEAKAFRHADAVVLESQGSGTSANLAGIMRGTEGQRLLTMFMSFFSSMYHLLRENAVMLKKGKISPAKFALNMLYLVIIPPVIEALARGEEPDGDEDWLKWAFKRTAAYATTPLVGIRDVAQVMLTDYEYQFSPATATLGKALQGSIPAVSGAFTEEEASDWQRAQFVNLIGILFKVPTRKVYQQMDYWFDVIEGEEELKARGVLFNKRED